MAEVREIKKESKPASVKATAVKERRPKAAISASSAFAIIETGGKQYRVSVGDTIKVEKIKADSAKGSVVPKEGDAVVFDKVILVDNGTDSTDIGTPYIAGAKVSATVTEIGRNAKVTVLKYKQKSRYLKKNGHRQPYFKVRIEKIG